MSAVDTYKLGKIFKFNNTLMVNGLGGGLLMLVGGQIGPSSLEGNF